MIWSSTRPAFRPGVSVVGTTTSRRASIGLLVADKDCALFALTVSTAVPPGQRARALIGERNAAFAGPALPLPRAPSSPLAAADLLVMLPLAEHHLAEPLLSGLEMPTEVAPLWKDITSPSHLARATGRVPLGHAIAAGVSFEAFDPVSETESLFTGAVEYECSALEDLIRDGEAGTAVLTASGDVVGILLGTVGDRALVAPLHHVLEERSLTLMGRHHLMEREAKRAELVREKRANLRERIPDQGEMEFIPPRPSTETTLDASPFAKTIARMARAA